MSSSVESEAQQQPAPQPPQQPRLAFSFTRTKTGRLAGASAQPLVADAAAAAAAPTANPQASRQLIVAIDDGNIEGAALADTGISELVVPLPAADQRSWAAAAAAAKRRRVQQAAETAGAATPAAAADAAADETASPAVRAILAECQRGGAAAAAKAADWTGIVEVPLPAVPSRSATEAAAATDVEVQEEVEDADYSAVPVESFGVAALRGMGFTGTAADLARDADKRELRVRPRGLGLGADGDGGSAGDSSGRKPPNAAASSAAAAASPAEPLQWKAGARCRVSAGRDAGHCGTLVSADGDADRWLVSVAQLAGETKSYPLAALELLTEAQFAAGRRLLNTGRVDRYRAEQSRRGWPRTGCLVKVCAPTGHPMYARKLRVVRELRDGAACRCALDDDDQDSKDKYYKDKDRTDKDYKDKDRNSKDRKDKDRNSKDSKDKDSAGWEFDAASLETVVPRRRGVRIVVVRGVLSGQLGRTVDERRAADDVVRVRLSDSGDCVSLALDDVCEFREPR